MPTIALLVTESLSWLIKVVTTPRNIEFCIGIALASAQFTPLRNQLETAYQNARRSLKKRISNEHI